MKNWLKRIFDIKSPSEGWLEVQADIAKGYLDAYNSEAFLTDLAKAERFVAIRSRLNKYTGRNKFKRARIRYRLM